MTPSHNISQGGPQLLMTLPWKKPTIKERLLLRLTFDKDVLVNKELILSEIDLKPFYEHLAYYKFFEWYTASSIRMGFLYQRDSMRHARDVCEGICNRVILHFSYYCKYGVLVFGDDGTGPANESKKKKRIQGWSRQIMGERLLLFAILLVCKITASFE